MFNVAVFCIHPGTASDRENSTPCFNLYGFRIRSEPEMAASKWHSGSISTKSALLTFIMCAPLNSTLFLSQHVVGLVLMPIDICSKFHSVPISTNARMKNRVNGMTL